MLVVDVVVLAFADSKALAIFVVLTEIFGPRYNTTLRSYSSLLSHNKDGSIFLLCRTFYVLVLLVDF